MPAAVADDEANTPRPPLRICKQQPTTMFPALPLEFESSNTVDDEDSVSPPPTLPCESGLKRWFIMKEKSFSKKMYWSFGSEAMTPITPFTVPKMMVGIWPTSESGSRMTREPCRNLLTNSPRWYSPTTSRRLRSSSVAPSLFFRTVKRLKLFSAPR
nr:Os05g0592450 [Ipomoea batatas]GME21794.1 Os05g0592450 [Ipomoea batatas]